MIDFSLYKTIQILMPFSRRKPVFIAWVKVFISYLVFVHEQLRHFRGETLKEAFMTPQVCYLEKFLNSRYGRSDIQIVEGYQLGPYVFSTDPPSADIDFFMVDPDYFVYSDEDSVTVNFVVQVPRALSSECNVIAAYVKKYKLAGKVFIIQLI